MDSVYIKKTSLFSWAIAVALVFSQLGNVIGVFLTAIVGHNSIDTAIQYVIGTICVGYALCHCRVDRVKYILSFILVIAALFLGTKYLHPGSYAYLQDDMSKVVFSMLSFAVVCAVSDVESIKEGLKISAYISFFYAIVIGLVISGTLSLDGFGTTYMEYGYNVFPAPVIFTYLYEKEHKRKYLYMTAISLVFILMFGSRGALLYYIIFFVFYNAVINGVFSRRYIFMIVGMLFIILLLTNSYVVSLIGTLLTNVFGFSSRSIEKILSGTVTSTSGRELLYLPALQLIGKNWILGTGIYSDRSLIYMASNDVASRGYGHYVHNFFLEIMMDFGVIFSIIFVAYYIRKFVFCMRNGSYDQKCIVTIFTSLWLFMSLTSGSFWYMPFFWGSLALLIEVGKRNSRRYD